MKCPICGKASRVLDTREGVHSSTLRRRVCVNETPHRFSTYEVYDAPFQNAKARLGQYARAIATRVARWQRNDAIVKDPRNSTIVAAEHGIKSSYVRKIRRTHL